MAIRIAAVFAMIVTIYALWKAIDAGLMLVFTGGGCEPSSELSGYVGLLNPLVLLIGIALQGGVIEKPSAPRLAWALGIPLLFWSLHATLNRLDDQEQHACAERSFSEALRYCKADPSWYRVGEVQRLGNTDSYYRVVSLVPPGEADDSWTCVSRWSGAHRRLGSSHKSVEYDIEVDGSVYHQHESDAAKRH